MERVQRGVAARREGDAIGRRDEETPAGTQHSTALGDEGGLVPQVFDDLEVHDHVDRLVWQGEIYQVAGDHRQFRVAPAGVFDGRRVVVDAGDRRARGGEHCAAVALTGACLENLFPSARLRDEPVGDLVAPEPVVLCRDAGNRPLAGQCELGIGVQCVQVCRRPTVRCRALCVDHPHETSTRGRPKNVPQSLRLAALVASRPFERRHSVR